MTSVPIAVNQLAAVLKAAGDPARVRILAMLRRGPLCVCQLVGGLGLVQSAVSKHLGILRRAGLVEGKREGRWLICRLSLDALDPSVRDAVGRLLDASRGDPAVARALRGAAKGTLPGVPSECLSCLPTTRRP